PLASIHEADAVLIGSGIRTRELVEDAALLDRIRPNMQKQLVGSQCSGALFLAHLGFLDNMPACTDRKTQPLLEAAGVRVLDQPFHRDGNVASAGGCLATQYLAAWVIFRGAGPDAVENAMSYVAPIGQTKEYTARVLEAVGAEIMGNS